jgi:alpha-glucosidase
VKRRVGKACASFGCALAALVALARCGSDAEQRARSGTPDAGNDASSDSSVTPGPLACDSLGPLPSFAVRIEAHRLLAHCDAVTLALGVHADARLRLRYVPADETHPERRWAISEFPAAAGNVTSGGSESGALVVCSNDFAAGVAPATCRVRVEDRAGNVLVDDGASGGFLRTSTGPRLTRQTPASERFYGFGQRTGSLDKRGHSLQFWNTDAYQPALGGWAHDQDPLYQSIPFFIGLRSGLAYGVLTDVAHRLELDMAKSSPEAYSISAEGGVLDQWIIGGPAMREVVRRYTAITGRTPLPPRWSLGFQQSRWGYSPADAFVKIGEELRARRIPADALWLDIQHMDGFRTFTFDSGAFPDPAGMIETLRAQGFATIAIADPGLKVDPGWSIYQGGVSGDHFLKYANGEHYEGVVWPGPSVFPDFSRAPTRAWWAELVAGFSATSGLAGIWLDVNEPTTFPESGGATIPNEVVADGDGTPTTMAEIHNVYALLEAEATFEGLRKARPDRRPFVLSRAGYAGIQRYAAVWTGDAPSSFASLETTMPMLLGMGLSGVPFVGSDVGGYSGNATPELYARWMAVGSISPFFRAHVTNGVPGQEPWMFGPEVLDLSRAMIEQRYRLLPYLYALFREAELSGAPILRPLVYEFQSDAAVHALGDQAMLGPFLLFAPVLAAGAETRTIYLPEGTWSELLSGAVWQGPTTIELGVTLAALPAFVRSGAILPHADVVQWTGEKPIATLHLDVHPAPDPSAFVLYEDAGDGHGPSRSLEYRLAQLADGARLDAARIDGSFAPPSRRLVIRIRRVDAAVFTA